jgi:hypothetical protein
LRVCVFVFASKRVGKHMTRAVNRLPQQATIQDRVAMAAQRGDHLFLAARCDLKKRQTKEEEENLRGGG